MKYDGCSGGMSSGWRVLFKKAPPWEGCCDNHDVSYASGGTKEQRYQADLQLMCCVEANGHPIWARIMFLAVRIGGHPLLPTPWRWGFLNKYPTFYSEK